MASGKVGRGEEEGGSPAEIILVGRGEEELPVEARMRAVKELGRHLKERGRADVEQRMHRAGESMARMEARVGEMMERRSSRSTAPE